MPKVSTKLFTTGDYGSRRLSAADLRALLHRGNSFVKAGIPIPVAPRFRDAAGMTAHEEMVKRTAGNLGFVEAFTLRPSGLYADCDVPDSAEAARLKAAGFAAVELEDGFHDGSGKFWPGPSIISLALKTATTPARRRNVVRLSLNDLKGASMSKTVSVQLLTAGRGAARDMSVADLRALAVRCNALLASGTPIPLASASSADGSLSPQLSQAGRVAGAVGRAKSFVVRADELQADVEVESLTVASRLQGGDRLGVELSEGFVDGRGKLWEGTSIVALVLGKKGMVKLSMGDYLDSNETSGVTAFGKDEVAKLREALVGVGVILSEDCPDAEADPIAFVRNLTTACLNAAINPREGIKDQDDEPSVMLSMVGRARDLGDEQLASDLGAAARNKREAKANKVLAQWDAGMGRR